MTLKNPVLLVCGARQGPRVHMLIKRKNHKTQLPIEFSFLSRQVLSITSCFFLLTNIAITQNED